MRLLKIFAATLLFSAMSVQAQDAGMMEKSCDDFELKPEAVERFAELRGSCEAIVERNGRLFAKTRAVVRRTGVRNVTLYLPATDHTFTVRPDSGIRALIDGEKHRLTDLNRGQEIRIYISVDEFAEPVIDEVAFVTEDDDIVEQAMEPVEALPTTASPWPGIAAIGGLLLAAGLLLRRQRVA
jgi:hypothetical protein